MHVGLGKQCIYEGSVTIWWRVAWWLIHVCSVLFIAVFMQTRSCKIAYTTTLVGPMHKICCTGNLLVYFCSGDALQLHLEFCMRIDFISV